MRVVIVQHAAFESPGHVQAWGRERGADVQLVRPYAGEALPPPAAYDLLFVMGGPMGVRDEARFPWLSDEKRQVRAALDAGKKVLAICFGSQLVAQALGAEVSRNPEKEIGWLPVEKTKAADAVPLAAGFPRAFNAFHWHGETFTLPKGAKHLFRSAACENQGFLYGKDVLALQFHPEVDAAAVEAMVANDDGELDEPRSFVQSRAAILAQKDKASALRPNLYVTLDAFMALR